ncbi:hypothetical protein H6P81_008038 [Aristolochia fimbriata]|uniref:Cytochrome P450 n=1 Tax=Aristolochia fimbriata TaxID=158543 RepID=A0AAV7F340_ARIFI|nr:hypothetical protein H6P81_008038 [Aristolochia fimbriata]
MHILVYANIFIFSLCLLYYSYKRKKNKQLPPGPVPWPIIGNVPELFLNRPTYKWILGLMRDMKTDIACIKLGNVHVVPVASPVIAREVLKQWDSVFASRPLTMATEYSSFGYLAIATAPWGDQWKKMRRVVASKILSNDTLGWLGEKRADEANNLIRYIYNQCKSSEDGADVDVRQVVRQYSGNVIRRMMFNIRYFGKGSEDGGPGVEEVEHVEALFSGIYLFYAFCVSDYVPCLRPFDLNGHEKIIKKVMKTLNKYHDPVIEKRMEEWSSGTKITKPEDLLDVFISLKDSNGSSLLTLQEIKAEVADLMYATVDNPSNAVEWVMAEMLNQPEILDKAVEEVDRIVGKDRLVQESDVPSLNYVKACIREAFRLHPNVPFNLPHLARRDTTVAGYFIPKDSHVLLSRIGLGRNPQVWDDPLVFKPERHLIDMVSTSQVELVETELRFISFSTGRRGCMAPTLGTAIIVMLLARLLQGFTWTIPGGVSKIDLSESERDLLLARALKAHVKPRLAPHLYAAMRGQTKDLSVEGTN